MNAKSEASDRKPSTGNQQPSPAPDHSRLLARTAEATASVMDKLADTHDRADTPEAHQRADRERRIAAAERASAVSLSRGELPDDADRAVIRDGDAPASPAAEHGGRDPGDQR